MIRAATWKGALLLAASGGFLLGLWIGFFIAFLFYTEENSAVSEPLKRSLEVPRESLTRTKPRAETSNGRERRSDRDAISDLRRRDLSFPIEGMDEDDFKDSFYESRGGHRHEAMDIPAPRNTPVVAVEDGVIAKLFLSKRGGLTIYQFDPTETYAHYYAHLERYADNLHEGDVVRQGQVIGYVGTSGNAPPNTPHLHFAVFQLTEEKKWWKGIPIDPYPLFK